MTIAYKVCKGIIICICVCVLNACHDRDVSFNQESIKLGDGPFSAIMFYNINQDILKTAGKKVVPHLEINSYGIQEIGGTQEGWIEWATDTEIEENEKHLANLTGRQRQYYKCYHRKYGAVVGANCLLISGMLATEDRKMRIFFIGPIEYISPWSPLKVLVGDVRREVIPVFSSDITTGMIHIMTEK